MRGLRGRLKKGAPRQGAPSERLRSGEVGRRDMGGNQRRGESKSPSVTEKGRCAVG